jgi:transmembrane sensor
MTGNINWEKIAQYFADELPDSERNKMERLLRNNPDLMEFIETLQLLRSQARHHNERCGESEWEEIAVRTGIRHNTSENKVSSQQFKSYSEIRREKRLASPYRTVFRLAASILLILGIAFLSYKVGIERYDNANMVDQLAMREVSTQKGQRVNLRFSDGTTVLLNSASILRFPEKFSGGIREVHLDGEAYFNVVTQEDRQFIVRAGETKVEVLGTKFNVRAWQEDGIVEVVVAEGKVAYRVEGELPENSVILTRGYLSCLLEDGSIASPKPVSLNTYLAWLDGKLIFDKTPVRDVLKQLERNYDMEFIVDEPIMYDRRITATFADESIDEILRALSISLNVRFERDGKKVVLVANE